jgi:hypothetical protein
MIEKIKNWLKERFSEREIAPKAPLGKTVAQAAVRPKKAAVQDQQVDTNEFVTNGPTKIEDAGPGKNVLIRNKYVREDTGTHETLKILDDSLVDSGEETGIDPYNTGAFDRSKNWNNRSRE